ncbi:MAG: hypothetical protein AAB558_02715 [Patescibacteria group bacterium]
MTTVTLSPVILEPPSTGFVRDKRSEGWDLLQAGCQVEGESVLELAGFLLLGEEYVNGRVMRYRSLEMGGRTGQHHAERMLVQVEAIPTEWREFYLAFPDTLWRRPGRCLFVPCLRWRDGRWVLNFRCVVRDARWNDDHRVVRVCKQPGS